MIKGIVHAHSANTVTFTQAGMSILELRITYSAHFYGNIASSGKLTKEKVGYVYEINTGKVCRGKGGKYGYSSYSKYWRQSV